MFCVWYGVTPFILCILLHCSPWSACASFAFCSLNLLSMMLLAWLLPSAWPLLISRWYCFLVCVHRLLPTHSGRIRVSHGCGVTSTVASSTFRKAATAWLTRVAVGLHGTILLVAPHVC
jgi:hypothetical protein